MILPWCPASSVQRRSTRWRATLVEVPVTVEVRYRHAVSRRPLCLGREFLRFEVIGTIVCMLNKGMKGAVHEGLTEQGELYRRLNQGGDSHVTSLLYGAGAPLIMSTFDANEP